MTEPPNDAQIIRIDIGKEIFCEFLEVAIHQILYLRKLYPLGVFERKKKYNVPVQICLHPEVAMYIVNIIDSINLLNKHKEVNKVAMVIVSAKQCPLEKFVFEMGHHYSPSSGHDTYLYDLEQSIRAFLLKLNVCDALLKTLPKDCTWTVQVDTSDTAAAYIDNKQLVKDFPWIEADPKHTHLTSPKIVPLKAVTSGCLQMQLYVEEEKHK